MKRTLPVALSTLAAIFLAGCNSSSDPDDSKSPVDQNTMGTFVGTLFQGLQYQIDNQTGVLSENGEFPSAKGKTITFSVGGIELGSADWAENLSPEQLQNTRLIDNGSALSLILSNNTVHGLDVVANQMALLSALDNDNNASNGFNLTNWHDALKDESVDFNLPYRHFIESELAEFADRHGLDATPSLHGLQGLFDAAGIQLRTYLVESRNETHLNNGTGYSVNYTFSYNAQGQITQEIKTSDNAADGTIDRIHNTEITFDTEGRQTRTYYTEDRNLNGSADYIKERLYSYNGEGRKVSDLERIDSDGDGYWDESLELALTYDAEGRLINEVKTDSDHHMFEPDLTHVYETSITYTAAGQEASKVIRTDYSGDGSINRIATETYSYDEAGNRIRHHAEYDNNNDGTINSTATTIREHDANNHMTLERIENDYDGDGDLEYLAIYEFTRDDQGRILSKRDQLDTNADGIVNFLRDTQTAYDEAGRKTSQLERVDTDLNGEYDSIVNRTYEYTLSESDQIIETFERVDAGNDGSVNTIITGTTDWNEWEQRTGYTSLQDSGNDGSVDLGSTGDLEYDANLNLLKEVSGFDKPWDGTPNKVDTYEYTYTSISTTLEAILSFRRDSIR